MEGVEIEVLLGIGLMEEVEIEISLGFEFSGGWTVEIEILVHSGMLGKVWVGSKMEFGVPFAVGVWWAAVENGSAADSWIVGCPCPFLMLFASGSSDITIPAPEQQSQEKRRQKERGRERKRNLVSFPCDCMLWKYYMNSNHANEAALNY